jgi:hypothetical protein
MRFPPRPARRLALLAALVALPGHASSQVIDPFYAGSYTFADLGSIPGVPPLSGGLNFALTTTGIDFNTLILGGNANDAPGALYAVPLIRDAGNHIVGFGGPATFYADAAFNDGGVTYGPGGVLFLSRWPENEVGQTKPGSTITDKIVPMAPLGVTESTGGLTFVPLGHPGAGQLKYVSWPTGLFYTLTIAPDGAGTYDITGATFETTIGGGPEGFAYVPLGSPLFGTPSMIVSEFTDNMVSTYELDASGNPVPATRRTFMTGLEGAEGALIDPVTGDFLFSTFGGGDRVIVVQGFAAVIPEPSSLVLGATGLVGLALVACRRRRD